MSELPVPSYLPEHMVRWYGVSKDPLFKYLDCACMTILFHYPDFINEVVESVVTNYRLALDFLNDKTKFKDMKMSTVTSLRVGDVLMYGAAFPENKSPSKMDVLAHACVFVGGQVVLSKPSYGRVPYGVANIRNVNSLYRSGVETLGIPITRLRRKI